MGEGVVESMDIAHIIHCCCGPDYCHNSFCDHRTVEYLPSLFLRLQAPGHQGRLGGMETRDGSAGDHDEKKGEDGIFYHVRLEVLHRGRGQLHKLKRSSGPVHDDAYENT